MHRGILLVVGGMALFVAGVLFSGSRDAFGVVPVTPYEADVNKDTRVNAIDLGQVAQKFGQPVPTATATPSSVCDLSGRDLRGIDLRYRGLGTYVGTPPYPYDPSRYSTGDLNDCRFRGTDLSNGLFGFASFRNSDFTDAILDGCLCYYTDFEGANLTGVSLLDFAGQFSSFAGANLTNATIGMNYPGSWVGVDFTGAITTGVTFNGWMVWNDTTCPDGTNSDNNGGSCIGHGFDGTPLPTWTPTATPTATATPDACVGVRWVAGNNHCYESFAPLPWSTAKTACEQIGAHLVTIGSGEENSFLFATFGPADYWIGFTDDATEGQWEWVTGEPVVYTNWRSGEPNDGGGGPNEDGALLELGGGTWNDGHTPISIAFICERAA